MSKSSCANPLFQLSMSILILICFIFAVGLPAGLIISGIISNTNANNSTS